jgi:DNA-binding HxlR family transcriptional regulator
MIDFETSKKNFAVYKNFDLLGKKWIIMILLEFWNRPNEGIKFSHFSKVFPTITSRAISMKLKGLEDYGILVHSGSEMGSVYELTVDGVNLKKVFNASQAWSKSSGRCDCDFGCEVCATFE